LRLGLPRERRFQLNSLYAHSHRSRAPNAALGLTARHSHRSKAPNAALGLAMRAVGAM
jgi:hypothetical protein